jgi:phosphopentomutase
MAVTSQLDEAVKSNEAQLKQLEESWTKIKSVELPKINDVIKKAGLQESIKVDINY